MQPIEFLYIFLTLLLSAFFSGIEIAFVSANKLKVELDSKQGVFSAKKYSKFMEKPANFIGTMLVGNNIALVMYGVLMAQLLEPLIAVFFHSGIAVLVLQTIVSTLVVLFTAEFLPKTIFRINPNRALAIFIVPVVIFFYLLYPIVFITIGMSNFILKIIFGAEIEEDKPAFGRIDLDNYLRQATENLKIDEEVDNEVQIFQNALDFSTIKIRSCMIPRTEIIALEINESIAILKDKFIETGLSKILIYKDNVDNIIGYVHSFELFKKPEAIKNIILPISIVPETMPANDTLTIFIEKKRGVAVVVDEFGGTSGMVTLEDLVEEIFGEIEDEHDHERPEEKQLEAHKFQFSGRIEIDHIRENYKLDIPKSEEYETLAGYIIHHHEDIPNQNEEIVIENFKFFILKAENNRIEAVILEEIIRP